MRKVEHIEQQIRELTSAEFAELRNWVLERDWAAWDAQIEADGASGKLDKLVARAKSDFDRGKARKFLKHYALPAFWVQYNSLAADVPALADKNYELIETDPRHPSLHFKRIGVLWSARIGGHYRALGHDVEDGVQWFWIGGHSGYDKLVG